MKAKDLLRKNSTYAAIHATMLGYQLAYLNGVAFKNAVRKKRPSEDEKLHEDLIANTASLPVARYIVDMINDTVFSQPVYRDLEFVTPQGIEIETELDWTELVCYDADLNNQSIDQFMAQVGEMTSVFGHAWVFVDMPSAEQGDSGRPYACLVSPLHVWDWHHTMVNGRYIPSYVKVLEYEDTHEYVFKCYYLGDQTTPSHYKTYRVYKNDAWDSPAELISEGNFPPGMAIPGFIAFTRRDPRVHDLGVSDIDCASEVQREIYKLECEAYQSIQFARTLIRADAGVKVPAHAGGIIRAPEGSVETLTVDTQDVDRITAKQQDLLMSLENLTGLGGLRQNRAAPQSGISIIEERKTLHKMAAAKARELEVAEEFIWTFMARFMGVRWAGDISYGVEYSSDDVKLKIAKLEVARTLSGNNPVIQSIIDKEVLDMLVDDSDERKLYEAAMSSIPVSMPNGTVAPRVEVEEPEEVEVESRDLGDQTPVRLDEHDQKLQAQAETPLAGDGDIGSMDPPIIYTGLSSYNPIADQLVARASGR